MTRPRLGPCSDRNCQDPVILQIATEKNIGPVPSGIGHGRKLSVKKHLVPGPGQVEARRKRVPIKFESSVGHFNV